MHRQKGRNVSGIFWMLVLESTMVPPRFCNRFTHTKQHGVMLLHHL